MPTMPDLPPSGSTAWYAWATAVDANARAVDGKADQSHSHVLVDLAALISIQIVETTTGVWSNTVPVRTSGSYPAVFVSATDPKDATNGVPGKANIAVGDVWIPTT